MSTTPCTDTEHAIETVRVEGGYAADVRIGDAVVRTEVYPDAWGAYNAGLGRLVDGVVLAPVAAPSAAPPARRTRARKSAA